ncbi:alpha/beta hydrolase [Bailinhaonella thermotolerans]|uniref:Alpha/beta hydrolase n=1 Tax=Bailinhaonella thermotolerans TaxID=1070861 RepID=A0A3A4A900_9ACTN|nr:alpha/beta hydrolase [Bailinhaonella thermotolerans]RJL25075.1 alpha/beta hydrolase [Bailinhaonella thermotolerans]
MFPTSIFGYPTREEGDPDRVAVLLPGGAYVPARPLLHFAGAVLSSRGWTVQEIWWSVPDGLAGEPRAEWAAGEARRALDAEKAGRLLLVGKSLGSFGATLAAERGLPAIWLTPLLNEPAVVSALRAATAPALLVGGTADPSWDPDLARDLGLPYLEIPGAHHGLEIEGDPVASARHLTRITEEMSRFTAALDS